MFRISNLLVSLVVLSFVLSSHSCCPCCCGDSAAANDLPPQLQEDKKEEPLLDPNNDHYGSTHDSMEKGNYQPVAQPGDFSNPASPISVDATSMVSEDPSKKFMEDEEKTDEDENIENVPPNSPASVKTPLKERNESLLNTSYSSGTSETSSPMSVISDSGYKDKNNIVNNRVAVFGEQDWKFSQYK